MLGLEHLAVRALEVLLQSRVVRGEGEPAAERPGGRGGNDAHDREGAVGLAGKVDRLGERTFRVRRSVGGYEDVFEHGVLVEAYCATATGCGSRGGSESR